MRTALKLAVTSGLMFAALACSGGDGVNAPTADFDQVKSSKQRLPADADSGSVHTLTRNNTEFALALLGEAKPTGNYFTSPHSISTALAMAYAGAAGSTKSEMQTALHFVQPDAELHAAFNTLDQKLESRGKGASGSDGKPFRLRVSNAAWAQSGYPFLPSYLDVLAQNYGAGINLLDFISDADDCRKTINKWVAIETEDKIPELLGPGTVNGDTRLVLTNTVYFNASWATPFEPKQTKNAAFTRLDGSSVSVPFMEQRADHRYAKGAGYEAVELQYDGEEVSMLLLLPDAGTFGQFEQSLDAQALGDVSAALNSDYEVSLKLPKFELRTKLSLSSVLSNLGMPTAFTPAADFSAMDGSGGLSIQDVIHEAFVKVNEAGTEAAAATAVTMGVTSVPETVSVTVDRPFLFVIRDNETKANVFLGRITDPSSSE